MATSIEGAPIVGNSVLTGIRQQPARQLALVALLANCIPALIVDVGIALNIVFRNLVGCMHGLKRQIAEERLAVRTTAVDVVDQLVGVGERGIKALGKVHRFAVLNPGGAAAR